MKDCVCKYRKTECDCGPPSSHSDLEIIWFVMAMVFFAILIGVTNP